MISPIRALTHLAAACVLLLSLSPSSSSASAVKKKMLDPGGGTAVGAPEDVRQLNGVSLHAAVQRALEDDALVEARFELTATRDLREDVSRASAFVGTIGPERTEVEVVLIPFVDKSKPDDKEGLIAIARSGARKAVSYCVLEKAVAPSEPGAVGLEIPIEDPGGRKIWLWEPGERIDTGEPPAPRYKTYFRCVFRKTAAGCAACLARCMGSVMLFTECTKYCCTVVFGYALISCAVEVMLV